MAVSNRVNTLHPSCIFSTSLNDKGLLILLEEGKQLIYSTGILVVGAGSFYIRCGDQGVQKSARRKKPV